MSQQCDTDVEKNESLFAGMADNIFSLTKWCFYKRNDQEGGIFMCLIIWTMVDGTGHIKLKKA